MITPEEALANELRDQELSGVSAGSEDGEDRRTERTWRFRAENVRDVAWAASPTFIWDAWGVEIPRTDGDVSMAMSSGPTRASRSGASIRPSRSPTRSRSIRESLLPVPVSRSRSRVNGPVGGMEYPMICFNGPRPEEDGTYTERTKYGLIA